MLINLWVRYKRSGHIHQVGTDAHDSLIFLDGVVQYDNLQNGCGTLDEYEWVEPPDLDEYVSVTPEEMYINELLIQEKLYEIVGNKRKRKKLLNRIKYPWGRLVAIEQYFKRLKSRRKILRPFRKKNGFFSKTILFDEVHEFKGELPYNIMEVDSDERY